jgi:hypothetical protein
MAKGLRPAGTIGVALTAWDLWRRIPPKQRAILLAQAKTHGPRVARQAYLLSRAVASRKTPPA